MSDELESAISDLVEAWWIGADRIAFPQHHRGQALADAFDAQWGHIDAALKRLGVNPYKGREDTQTWATGCPKKSSTPCLSSSGNGPSEPSD